MRKSLTGDWTNADRALRWGGLRILTSSTINCATQSTGCAGPVAAIMGTPKPMEYAGKINVAQLA